MRSSSSRGSGGSGGCGKAELLWMADGNGRALGKRANAKVGEDCEKRVAAGKAAAAGAAGGPGCCGWRMAMAGRREACEHQGWGGLAQAEAVAAGEAAAGRAAVDGGWQWQGAREACEDQGWGGLAP